VVSGDGWAGFGRAHWSEAELRRMGGNMLARAPNGHYDSQEWQPHTGRLRNPANLPLISDMITA